MKLKITKPKEKWSPFGIVPALEAHAAGQISDLELAEARAGLGDAIKARLRNIPSHRDELCRVLEGAEAAGVDVDPEVVADLEDMLNDNGFLRLGKFKGRFFGALEKIATAADLGPGFIIGQKTQGERTRGGLDSHGLTEYERQERNAIIQQEVDRLCLERRLSYKAACTQVGKKVQQLCEKAGLIADGLKELHKDTVRDITTNPHHSI